MSGRETPPRARSGMVIRMLHCPCREGSFLGHTLGTAPPIVQLTLWGTPRAYPVRSHKRPDIAGEPRSVRDFTAYTTSSNIESLENFVQKGVPGATAGICTVRLLEPQKGWPKGTEKGSPAVSLAGFGPSEAVMFGRTPGARPADSRAVPSVFVAPGQSPSQSSQTAMGERP
jgi:hypothetical protein